jgi:hypothetical protein
VINRRPKSLVGNPGAALDDRAIKSIDCFAAADKVHQHYLEVTAARREAGKTVY